METNFSKRKILSAKQEDKNSVSEKGPSHNRWADSTREYCIIPPVVGY